MLFGMAMLPLGDFTVSAAYCTWGLLFRVWGHGTGQVGHNGEYSETRISIWIIWIIDLCAKCPDPQTN